MQLQEIKMKTNLDITLKRKEINMLPVATIKCQNIPELANLSTPTQC